MASEGQQLGRAKNAVLSLLERRLSVPKIYIDANWDGIPVDLLAIDRDGVGDVHVVLMFLLRPVSDVLPDMVHEARKTEELIEKFKGIPAQFKYLAGVDSTQFGSLRPYELSKELKDRCYATDGIGRVGVLSVKVPEEQEPTATFVMKPERFRATIASLADAYVQQHAADWEIRA